MAQWHRVSESFPQTRRISDFFRFRLQAIQTGILIYFEAIVIVIIIASRRQDEVRFTLTPNSNIQFGVFIFLLITLCGTKCNLNFNSGQRVDQACRVKQIIGKRNGRVQIADERKRDLSILRWRIKQCWLVYKKVLHDILKSSEKSRTRSRSYLSNPPVPQLAWPNLLAKEGLQRTYNATP